MSIRNVCTPTGESDGLLASAVQLARSPLLYVGAVTVAFANEIVEWLVGWGLVTEPWATLVLFPVTLALLYAQLLALAYYRRSRDEE